MPPGRCARSARTRRTEPGWALARFGDGGWWPAISAGLQSGHVRGRCRSTRSRMSCGPACVRGVGVRGAVPAARRHARRAGAALAERLSLPCPGGAADRAAAAAARDGQRRPAGGQRSRRVHGARDRRRAVAGSCLTTAGSPGGRWPWSAVSCGWPAQRGWCRWRWGRFSEREGQSVSDQWSSPSRRAWPRRLR